MNSFNNKNETFSSFDELIKEECKKENRIPSSEDPYKKALRDLLGDKTEELTPEERIQQIISHPEDAIIPDLVDYLRLLPGRSLNKGNAATTTTVLSIVDFFGNPTDSSQLENPVFYRENLSRSTSKPEVVVSLLPNGFVSVDLIFISASDPELKLFYKELETFKVNYTDSMKEDIGCIPIAEFAFMPDTQLGLSYLSLSNPIFFCIMPQNIGDVSNNVLRILFMAKDMDIIELDSKDREGILEETAYSKRLACNIDTIDNIEKSSI